ncbi:MAG: signal recognition particle-docking protein FtsY [Tissierellia bacterium]|nr:signal recognition particle-docking protein FtsY [Tissierellia bacterium]
MFKDLFGRKKEEVDNPDGGLFEKLRAGLDKTRKGLAAKVDGILGSYSRIDEELYDDLEEILVTADVGVGTTMDIIDNLKDRIKEERIIEPRDIKIALEDEIKDAMRQSGLNNTLEIDPPPAVILVVGANGVGKTTTIAKLAYGLKHEGKRVILAAGDTFRAGAIEQLSEWSKRVEVELVAHSEGADPAAVIFDGIQASRARDCDVLICDTAGRLHNKKNLMDELNKISRVIDREYADAQKEILLVLDATTGQNAIAQAQVFKEACNVSGIVLTKLDGTAKGGVAIALQTELGIPIKFIGVGERVDDLQRFDIDDFVDAIFG